MSLASSHQAVRFSRLSRYFMASWPFLPSQLHVNDIPLSILQCIWQSWDGNCVAKESLGKETSQCDSDELIVTRHGEIQENSRNETQNSQVMSSSNLHRMLTILYHSFFAITRKTSRYRLLCSEGEAISARTWKAHIGAVPKFDNLEPFRERDACPAHTSAVCS